jgi:hypothetical protein
MAAGVAMAVGAAIAFVRIDTPSVRAELGATTAAQRSELTVDVALRNVPDGATVLLDGEPMRGTRVARDGVHRVEVRAPGFAPWMEEFLADGDVVLDVELEPIVEPPPRRVAKAAPPEHPPPEDPPPPAAAPPRRATATPALIEEPGF